MALNSVVARRRHHEVGPLQAVQAMAGRGWSPDKAGGMKKG